MQAIRSKIQLLGGEEIAYEDPAEYDQRNKINETEWYIYSNWHPYLISKMREIGKGKLVVDLGCGTCEFTQHLDGSKAVIGLDYSSNMLNHASNKVKELEALLLRGDACKIPIKSNISDVIYGIGLIPYVNLEPFLMECKRILGNNGKIMLVFANKWNLYNLQYSLIRKIFRRKNYDRREYSYKEVKVALEKAGFIVLDMKCFGMVTYCPMPLQKIVKYIWRFMDKIYSPFQSALPLGISIMVLAEKRP